MLASRIVKRCTRCGQVAKGMNPQICPRCGGDRWEAISNVLIKGAERSAPISVERRKG